MKLKFFFLCLVFAISSPLYGQGLLPTVEDEPTFTRMSVVADTFLWIENETLEIVAEPLAGHLSLENGIVYTPDSGSDPTGDHFLISAKHGLYDDVPLFLSGLVLPNGALEIQYFAQKDKDSDDNDPHENGDGTVTAPVVFEDGTVIDIVGTIVCEPNTAPDLPAGTVILGTAGSGQTVIAAENDGEIHTHTIGNWNEVRQILGRYPSGSIPALVFHGHGSGGGGIYEPNGDGDEDDVHMNGHNIPDSVVNIIKDRLTADATIYIAACDQFECDMGGFGIKLLAVETGHPVVANEGPVATRGGILGLFREWWGVGNWIEVSPDLIEPEHIHEPPK